MDEVPQIETLRKPASDGDANADILRLRHCLADAQRLVAALDQRLSIAATDARGAVSLDEIWSSRSYLHEPQNTKNIALCLQPTSFSEFGKHREFAEVSALFKQGDEFRGLDFVRIWSMILNIKHALAKCPGAVAELGVYRGQSSALLSYYAQAFMRKMYLADTFSGFAEEQFEEDMGPGKQAAFKDITVENAQRIVGNYEGNRWIVGMFPASVTEEMRADTYAFVSIDCDIYEPIIRGLEFFWPRMNPGGIILVHDYGSGHWPGATRAVDEFCAEKKVSGCLMADFAGSFVLAR
jgi:O-methyltransferase